MSLTILSIWPYFVIMAVFVAMAAGLGKMDWAERIASEQESDSRFKPGLESLRGILSISVFFHHAVITYFFYRSGEWVTPPSQFYSLLGPTPVLVFFILTGYLFWQKLLKTGHIPNVKKFYAGRCRRILPAYWAVFCIVVICAFVDSGGQLREIFWYLVCEIFHWLTVGLPFGNFPSINRFGETGLVLAGVYWSLRYEMLFYLLLPLLACFALGKRTLFLFFVALTLPTAMDGLHFKPSPNFAPYWGLVRDFLGFFKAGWSFGMIISFLQSKTSLELKSKLQSNSAAAFALICVVLHFVFPPRPYSLQHTFLVLPLFTVVAFGNLFFGCLAARPLVFLGRISYSFYLSQGIFLFLLAKLYQRFSPVRDMTPTQFWIFALVSGGCTLGFSTALYYFVERPFFEKKSVLA